MCVHVCEHRTWEHWWKVWSYSPGLQGAHASQDKKSKSFVTIRKWKFFKLSLSLRACLSCIGYWLPWDWMHSTAFCSLCSFPWANQLTVSVEGKGWEGQSRIQEFHFCQNHTTTKTLAAIIQNILGCLQVLVCYVMHSTWLAIVSHWWRRLFSPWLRSSQPLFCKPCLFSLCHANYFLFVECIA